MLSIIPTGKKVKFKASTCKANTNIHEAAREKGVPKHPRHLKTCKKLKANISPEDNKNKTIVQWQQVPAYSKEKYIKEIEDKMLT